MIETPFFWFCASTALAGITIWMAVFEGPYAVGLMMLNTMIASANFGAKCVRREHEHREEQEEKR